MTEGRRNHPPTVEDARDLLAHMTADCSHDLWVEIAMAIKAGLGEAGWPVFEEWSQTGSTYVPRTCRATWDSIKANGPVTYGTLVHHAQVEGWQPSKRNTRRTGNRPRLSRAREDAGRSSGPAAERNTEPPTTEVARAILAAAVPADDTPARAYLAGRGTWPADGPDLPPAVRWLPPSAWAHLPTWPGKDGRSARLTPPPSCGAVVFKLARPGYAPDAVTLEAVTHVGERPAERWRRSPGGTIGRTFTVPAPSGDGWSNADEAPLVVAVVEGEADALALARLRLAGVLVRSAGGTSGKGRPAALVADLPATVAVALVSDGDKPGRGAVVELHTALHAAGRTCYAAVLTSGDPDSLLRGADDTALVELHTERAAILEHDGGLPRPAATACALARLLETLPRRRT